MVTPRNDAKSARNGGWKNHPGPGCSLSWYPRYPSPFLGITPNSHFAPGRRFGLELLQSMLLKEHQLNLTGSYNTPLLGTLTYAVPR